jgi:hypothetical protein
MSDGITEAYRASRAADDFWKLWENANIDSILLENANIDSILLDFKSYISHISIEDIVLKLTELCPKVEIRNYNRFEEEYNGRKYYTESVMFGSGNKLAKRWAVEIGPSGVHKKFEENSLIEALREALLFAEWTQTEAGKKAVEIYSDY